MKRLTVFILTACFSIGTILPQKAVTLKECYDKAALRNSIAGEIDIYNSIWLLRDENISKNWLPTLDINGSFVYNSSVIDLGSSLGSIPIPGIADAIKPLPHEQYRITFDVNQVFYAGGAFKNARAVEKANLGVSEKQTETDLYKIKDQVNNYYFRLLLIIRQKELLSGYHEVIIKKILAMQSALENGMITKPDLDVLSSERIRLEQQLNENDIRKISLVKVLSDITGIPLDTSATLILPAVSDNLPDSLSRPELQLFDLRKDQLSAGIRLTASKRLPKAFGFATVGYGNPPGNNFFRDEFASYYILGAGIKWNLFDWNKTKNEKGVLILQQNIIEARKSDLSENLNRLLESKKAEIESLKSLVKSDNELIEIRKRITASAESQYDNGTLTATDYLNELNSEREAVINHEIHSINLAMAKIEYLNISGNEIE